MIPPALLAGAMLSTTSASAAPAGPPARWSVSVTEEGAFRSWNDKVDTVGDESLQDGMNRLYLLVSRGGLEVGAQTDLAFAFPEERAGLVSDETPPLGSRDMLYTASDTLAVDLEKKFVRYRTGGFAAELGDVYRSVGRGLVLSVLRNTELDVDTSIEGAALDWEGARLSAGAWGGLSNPQTISSGFRNVLRPDVRDPIAGARIGFAADEWSIGAHAAALQVDEKFPGVLIYDGGLFDVERWTAAGASLSIPSIAGVDLYLEGDLASVDGNKELLDGRERETYPGEALYGAATWGAGGWTVQLEGKRYRRFELLNVRQGESEVSFDYATPPSLEKEEVVTTNTQDALNSNDIAGGRVSLARRIGAFLTRVTWLHESYWDLPARGVQDFSGNEDVEHVTIGAEHRGIERFFQLAIGCRYETRHSDDSVHDVQVHVDGDALFSVAGIGVELKGSAWRQRERSLFTGEKIEYDVSHSIVSIRPFRFLSVSGLLDTTSDISVISGAGQGGNVSEKTFGAVEISVEPTDGSTARVFAGATQGGLKCSGGTCRVVPAFEGVRVEWLARF